MPGVLPPMEYQLLDISLCIQNDALIPLQGRGSLPDRFILRTASTTEDENHNWMEVQKIDKLIYKSIKNSGIGGWR